MPLGQAKAHWEAGRPVKALAAAWEAYDAAPDGAAERRTIARILSDFPDLPCAGHGDALRALVSDPTISPGNISAAGWRHLLNETDLFAAADNAAALARRLEDDALALTLLHEDVVADARAEAALTDVRRRLLEDGLARQACPTLTAALIAQAALNGGAWPFDEQERARFAEHADFVRAYLPEREAAAQAGYDDPVTRAVAQQYEGWPYPQWTRVTRPEPTTLAAQVRRLDPDGPQTIPEGGARILIAGCGTGRQAAAVALLYPREHFTAIDISGASLRYAAARCAEMGIGNVDFRLLDLHAAAALGGEFDAVFCTGVLHHLPDPEAGWTALNGVLKPGGVMRIMVYSKLARMRVAVLRRSLGEWAGQAISDDILRAVRRRILEQDGIAPPVTRDFYSLAGVHDLLMHRHEDPFDVRRIQRALAALSLTLLRFEIPRNGVKAAYHAANPHDPLQRDFAAWAKLEMENPGLYGQMYDLWCRKPA